MKNNVFLSHSALHLFMQSKMTIEEIEQYIDSKCDDEPYDTILAESAFKVSLHPNETSFTAKNRLHSKQDSGIDSCEHDEAEPSDDLESTSREDSEFGLPFSSKK